MNRPMNRSITKAASVTALLLGALQISAPAWSQATELRPNIRALPAFDLTVARDLATGQPELLFSVTTWNSGRGPLEIVAGEMNLGKQNVYQRVRFSDGTHYDRLAGSFAFHTGHSHFHFENYAVYSLQPIDAPGRSARSSSKTTFCLLDTDKIDVGLAGAPRKAIYTTCGNQLQGISVGWGDTYGWHLPGQAIDLSDWTDGRYKLSIVADPDNRLLETDESDNSACLLVDINIGAQTAVPVTSASCSDTGGPVTVSAITPSFASVGSRISVTISGSGFVPGMTVSFEQGSGAKPTASNVVVQSASTITAVVTVKKGTIGSDPVWDLRVGSGVLPDAFVVQP